MLTIDFLARAKEVQDGIYKEKFLMLTPYGKDLYEYTDDSDGESFTTKFIMVPKKCTWSFEIEEFISTGECIMVPKEYYEFIYFLGIRFPFSFCIEKDGGK